MARLPVACTAPACSSRCTTWPRPPSSGEEAAGDWSVAGARQQRGRKQPRRAQACAQPHPGPHPSLCARVPEVGSVFLNMPNLHFLPCNPVASGPFADDVYMATGEPHGNIEAVVTRQAVAPHCRL